MNNVNIFDNTKPQSGEFFKFKNVGDSVQGTYIDVRNGVDSFGNQQTIYVVQDSNGKVWNLGFRETALVIHERMKGIHFGQIVGFRYDEERDSKRKPGTKVKIIRIYADPKFVDHEWLAHEKEIEKNYSKPLAPMSEEINPHDVFGDDEEGEEEFKVPANATAETGALPTSKQDKPKNEAIDAIRNLAKTKGLTNETMTEEEADNVIEKYTGLKLEEINLTKIIVSLTGYVSK